MQACEHVYIKGFSIPKICKNIPSNLISYCFWEYILFALYTSIVTLEKEISVHFKQTSVLYCPLYKIKFVKNWPEKVKANYFPYLNEGSPLSMSALKKTYCMNDNCQSFMLFFKCKDTVQLSISIPISV